MTLAKAKFHNGPNHLSIALKRERVKAGLSQTELALRSGLGLKTIRKVEQGDESVQMKNVNKLLNFFGLELGPQKLVTSPNIKKKKELSQEDVLSILNGLSPIFKAKYNVDTLGLFGSYAREEQTLDSDIDILFDGDTNFSSEGEMTLILEHLLEGKKIDLTKKRNLDPRLSESILSEVIYV